MSDIKHEAPERIWAYAGSFKMWRDHQTDQPHKQTEYVRVDRIEELEAMLAKAMKLIEYAIELGRWDLNPSLRDDLIDFSAELKGETDGS